MVLDKKITVGNIVTWAISLISIIIAAILFWQVTTNDLAHVKQYQKANGLALYELLMLDDINDVSARKEIATELYKSLGEELLK